MSEFLGTLPLELVPPPTPWTQVNSLCTNLVVRILILIYLSGKQVILGYFETCPSASWTALCGMPVLYGVHCQECVEFIEGIFFLN